MRSGVSKWGLLSRWSGSEEERVAHLARQVEGLYHKAKRDQGSISLTASHWRLELGQLGCRGSPRAP
eukprot:scaffold615_cov387-Pavlova_lutheri.AAC.3